MRQYWRRAEVERLAWQTLIRFRHELGTTLRLPVDVDLIGELVCGLQWDWDVIPEPPGRRIWAGLFPGERRVVMNERHLAIYRRNEGLERFTKAHELGHWICHVLEGFPARRTPADRALVYLRDGTATDWRERHANWFAAALLMPAPRLLAAARDLDLSRWRDRYTLRDHFNVSISALNRRLETLGLVERVG
jgi:hypothetical protein